MNPGLCVIIFTFLLCLACTQAPWCSVKYEMMKMALCPPILQMRKQAERVKDSGVHGRAGPETGLVAWPQPGALVVNGAAGGSSPGLQDHDLSAHCTQTLFLRPGAWRGPLHA